MATAPRRLRRWFARDGERPVGETLLAAAVAALVVSPVVWLLLRAGDLGASAAGELVESSAIQVLVNSVLLTTTVTGASLVLGVVLAVLTVKSDLPMRRFWTVVLALPLVVPSYIGAFAFVSAFGPRGTLADALAPLGIQEIPTIYGFHGTAVVLTLYIYPYVFLTTRAALLGFDGRLVEAARSLGHGRLSAFRRVTLPQIAPGALAGALLVALYTLSDFGTPAIMHFDVFTRQIYVYNRGGLTGQAALLSLELLAVTAVILALESRLSGGDAGAHVSQDPGAGETVELGAWKLPALGLCLAVATLALVVPIGVLLNWLFRGGGTNAYAGMGFGYQFELQYGFNSVYVSLLAAAVATLAALPVAHLAARHRSRVSRLLDRATYFGYAAPGIVLGLALVYFGQRYAPMLYQTIPLLVFAYVVRFLPQSVGAIRSSLLQVDPALVEAARTLGHGSASTFRRVTLPLISPGVVTGAALVFLTTMKELPATLLLHPTGFRTLVTYIWLAQSAGFYGRAAAPALALVAISAVSMLVLLAQERYHD